MSDLVWVDIEFDDRPEYGPPCPGIGTHRWRITIEEGRMGLTSGCTECDEGVLGPVGGEDVFMRAEILGSLKVHVERSFREIDYVWWEFLPEEISPIS